MTQASPSSSSAIDVAASQRDACERMRATTNVTLSAIDELGHMSRHRALQSVATLQTVDRLVSDPQVQHLITADVASHLHAMQSAYFERIAAVEENASQHLLAIADWMPQRGGLFATLRKIVTFEFVTGGASKALSVEDVIQGMNNPTAATEGIGHVPSAEPDRAPGGMSDEHGRVPDPQPDDDDAVRAKNGTAGDIEGDEWRVIGLP